MADAKNPYHAVMALLMDLLEFQYDTPHQEREQALFQTFRDPFIIEHLPLLNDLLHLKVSRCSKAPSNDIFFSLKRSYYALNLRGHFQKY